MTALVAQEPTHKVAATTSSMKVLPEQRRFLLSKAPLIIYLGGIGAGKTFIACIKAIAAASKGRKQLILGLTHTQARDVILETLEEVFVLFGMIEGKHYKIDRSRLNVKIFGGSVIYIRSLNQANNLRGMKIADAYIDEAAYHKDQEVFNILLGRMREVEDGQMHLTTSPAGFNWVFDIHTSAGAEFIKCSTFANSFLPERYIKNMIRQYGSQFIRQELYADFVQMSSNIFRSSWVRDGSQLQDVGQGQRIRFWDFAFSDDNEADYSAGVLLEKRGSSFLILDIVRVKQNYETLKKTIAKTAQMDGRETVVGFENAGQQKAIILNLSSMPELALHQKRKLTVAKYGRKIHRILPVASMAELGQLYISSNCRNRKEFFEELDALSMDDSHRNDDMIDALASAYICLNEGKKTRGHKGKVY